MRNKIIIEDRS